VVDGGANLRCSGVVIVQGRGRDWGCCVVGGQNLPQKHLNDHWSKIESYCLVLRVIVVRLHCLWRFPSRIVGGEGITLRGSDDVSKMAQVQLMKMGAIHWLDGGGCCGD